MERLSREFSPQKFEEADISSLEKEIDPEQIKNLPEYEEPGAYYRALSTKEALMALFGKLQLESSSPEDEKGHDNAAINLADAIYFGPTCQTKKGEKFLCAIGFKPLPEAQVENSRLGRWTFKSIKGPIVATEVVLRFAGKKTGQPQEKVKFLSPKAFFEWHQQNV